MKNISAWQRPWGIPLVAASMLAILSGCATYQPRPLEDRSPLVAKPSSLQVKAAALPGRSAGSYDINLADGLNLIETGIIAVLNNPGLKLQRARLQIAGAQVFSAGLLPDPQLGASLDKPTGNAAPDTAWLVGLSYDIIPLITRQARIDAERKNQEKVHLDLLWQEWQVIQRARTLTVRLQLEEQRLALLHTMSHLYQKRYQRSAEALKNGDITLDINGTDLTALVDTLSQINQLERTHNQTRHNFNLLLGLEPRAKVSLSPLPRAAHLDLHIVNIRLGELPKVRPDLLALKAGYESQEARVRAAILAQFPSLGIGVNRTSDTSNVDTIGLSISLTLPLFSGNRGKIAIERATREQLHEEYRVRLAQTNVDVDRLLTLQTILHEQQGNLQTYLPRLKMLVERARRAYHRGDIGALTFLNMESTWVNNRLEQISLEQTTWENRIALEALLALPSYTDEPLSKTP